MTNSNMEIHNKKEKHRKRSKKVNDQIKKQMEFYFGDSNMGKDRFLKKLIDQSDDGFVSLETFLSFNKIRHLGCGDITTITKALRSSTMLTVSKDGLGVKRVTPIGNTDDVDDRTIYVENLPLQADHDWVTQTFSGYGKVTYVSLPRYKSTGDLKGFGFVEFSTQEAARVAVEKLKADESDKVHCFPKAGNKDIQRLTKQARHIQHETGNLIEAGEESHQHQQQGQKRVRSDSESDSESERPKKVKLESDDSDSESESADENTDNVVKKRKKQDDSNCPQKKRKKNETSPVKSILKSAKSDSESEDVKIETTEKKKKRKQKNKKKEEKKTDLKLKVISKREWLHLREGYLAAQKSRMSMLKKSLHKTDEKDEKEEAPSTGPKYNYQEGVIVRIESESTPLHRKSLREQLVGEEGISYVDLLEGRLTCHVRCKDPQSAKQILKTNVAGLDLSLVEGEEEKLYWQKMSDDREKKLSQPKRGKNKRGQQKIKDKAERVTLAKKVTSSSSSPPVPVPGQKHVYFGD